MLCAALICVQIQCNGQACGLRHQLSCHMGGAETMFSQYTAVSDAKLYHKFLFSIMCH
ncbi:hypothetical protein EVA_15299 [gut metagenome]|uniref:Uncharacterized protein n=1 Tax=gut metagenome TaxID=749906 RepID=J9FQ50_9ZZZZ